MNIRYDKTERLTHGKTTHRFHVDGFHRQANNTLRRLILDAFPTVSIDKPLKHTVASFSEALNDNKIVLATLRDPRQSINSLCGFKNIDPFDKKNINIFIESYCYLHEYLYQNNDLINFVHFNNIISSPINLLFFIKNKYIIKKNNFKKYKNLSFTPFFTAIDENGFYEHNATSSLIIEKKLQPVFNSKKFREAEKIYSIIVKQINNGE